MTLKNLFEEIFKNITSPKSVDSYYILKNPTSKEYMDLKKDMTNDIRGKLQPRDSFYIGGVYYFKDKGLYIFNSYLTIHSTVSGKATSSGKQARFYLNRQSKLNYSPYHTQDGNELSDEEMKELKDRLFKMF